MDAGAVYELPAHPRHLAVDENGVGLRATWYPERGFVNLSLWSADRCVQTFHLTPLEAGRLIAYLAGVLADAVPEPAGPSALAAVPDPPQPVDANRWLNDLGRFRRELARTVGRAAHRLRP